MTLIKRLYHVLHHYVRLLLDTFSYKLPNDLQIFRKDCETLVERYNKLLKEISSYMKDHSRQHEDDPDNSEHSFTYHDTDSFYLISIKQDLAILTDDCKELLEKGAKNTDAYQLQNEGVEQYLNQLQELRKYSVQIETALHEYEENIMKIEEEISNNTLCN